MLNVSQTTGSWTYADGTPVVDVHNIAVVGWAGNDCNPTWNPTGIKGKNNPDMDGVANIGPLPLGDYTIRWLSDEEAKAHAHLGPMLAELIPDAQNDMKGRSGFFIHGAARDPHRHGQESRGCTVLERIPRQAVKDSGETSVRVVR
jgi:hypothetical protein